MKLENKVAKRSKVVKSYKQSPRKTALEIAPSLKDDNPHSQRACQNSKKTFSGMQATQSTVLWRKIQNKQGLSDWEYRRSDEW